MSSTAVQPPPPVPPPPPSAAPSAGKGIHSKLYNGMIGAADKFVPAKLRPLWMHPAGPKTIFFWAPVFKWGLVAAGLSDLARPADTISVSGCAALAATGIIWSRYSLVIIPKNYSLFAVNLFVGITQVVQLARAYHYHQSQEKLKQEQQQPAVQN
ncbi:mitochondrial pyruvate carrier 2 [Drosophila sechellia]|uniref:Mitochondrial pyruvate carrier n=2 Tax=melanogaster subgroup TaxID=32351 RepID=B4HJX6_DROSE|nr:mitochondrial pyruvate carrier 2 [Drosophila sechellia]XP_033165488.1 mitochondrial pyruvate carrier 2 [Drosophila mauritiana]EDW42860.1 GM26242 [Drosophila sechellia]